jgi:hypothetical protein
MSTFILALSLIGMATASAIAQQPPRPHPEMVQAFQQAGEPGWAWLFLAPPPGTKVPPPPHQRDSERAKIMFFDRLFALMDTDGDGTISKEEMLAWLRDVHFGHGEGEEQSSEEQSCGSTDTPATPVDCTDTSGNWQEVSNVLSEANCQFGYTDAQQGPNRMVIYDNNYSVACVGGSYEPSVYVGLTPSNSNWGAFVQPSKTCQMKTGTLPSNPSTRVVERIVCPAP